MKSTLIPLDEIKVDYDKNPRKEVDDDTIEELMESIVAVRQISGTHKSLLQPIVVRPINDDSYKYELRFGYRRYTAMKRLFTQNPRGNVWANKIESVIDDHDPDDEEGASEIAFALIENIQRQEMTPIDEANALKLMIDDFGMKQKDIANMLGKSKGWVSQRLKLTKLAPPVQAAVADGKVGHSAARQLTKIDDSETQKEVLQEGLKKEWQEKDWKNAANRERRKERKEKKPDDSSEDTKPPEKETDNDVNKRAQQLDYAYSVERTPGEVKDKQEQAEFDGKGTSYETGVSNALLWVLGLLEDPMTEENETEIKEED